MKTITIAEHDAYIAVVALRNEASKCTDTFERLSSFEDTAYSAACNSLYEWIDRCTRLANDIESQITE